MNKYILRLLRNDAENVPHHFLPQNPLLSPREQQQLVEFPLLAQERSEAIAEALDFSKTYRVNLDDLDLYEVSVTNIDLQ